MSVAPVNIQLYSIPSTSSSSPGFSPPGTATSTQTSSVSGNASGSSLHNIPPNASSNASSTITNNLVSNPAPGTTGSNLQPTLWQKMQRTCISLAKFLIAVAGIIITYLALSTAMWSSAKDYRDDCRSQNEIYGHVSKSCNKVLNAVLSSPLGLGMFLSEPETVRRRLTRKDQLPAHPISDDQVASVFDALIVIAGACVIGLFLTFLDLRPSSTRAFVVSQSTPHSGIEPTASNTYAAWVDASVPRIAAGSNNSLLGAESTTVRLRLARNTGGKTQAGEGEEKEGDWLPTGTSAIKRQPLQVDGSVERFLDHSNKHSDSAPREESPVMISETRHDPVDVRRPSESPFVRELSPKPLVGSSEKKEETWHQGIGRQATIVRQVSRAKSIEGLLVLTDENDPIIIESDG